MAFADIILVNSGSSFDINLSTAQILGTTNGVASVSGALSGISGGAISGISNGVATVSGTLTPKAYLSGSCSIIPTLNNGLISYWKCDEGIGNGTVYDNHNNNDGTPSGCTQGATGKISNCLDFDGSGSVSMGTTSNLKPTQITVGVWINGGLGYSAILANWMSSGGYNGYALQLGNGYPEFGVNNASAGASAVGTTNVLESWYFIVGTFDGTTVRVYINGVSEGTPGSFVGSIGYGAGSTFYIGELETTNDFDGLIDEVFIYDRALSQAEITALFNKNNGTSHPFLKEVSGTLIAKGKLRANISLSFTYQDDFGSYADGVTLYNQTGWAAGYDYYDYIHVFKNSSNNNVFRWEGTFVDVDIVVRRTTVLSGDCFAEIQLKVVAGSYAYHGVSLRGTSGAPYSFYLLSAYEGRWYLEKNIAGVWTNPGNEYMTFYDGDWLRLEIIDQGSTAKLRVFVNDVLRGEYIDTSPIASGGYPGVMTYTSSSVVESDNFGVGNVALVGATVTGNLQSAAGGGIAGVSNGVATVTGLAFFRLLGACNGVATVSGTLVGEGILIGQTNGICTPANSGTLVGDGKLVGASNGVADVSGVLVGHCYPAGVINGVASCSAILIGHCYPIGITSGVADVSGTSVGIGSLAGVINGVASCSGTPVQLSISGHSDGVALVSGICQVNSIGSSSGVATVLGVLVGKGILSGMTGRGPSLMDSGKGNFDSGTESWVAYGTNIISNDAGALKIEYQDSQYGAYTYLRGTSDLSQDLIIGKSYVIDARVKVGSGNTIVWQFYNGATGQYAELFFQESSWTWIHLKMIAQSTTGGFFRLRTLGTGEIVWIDEWLIYELAGAITSGAITGKGRLIGVSNGVASVSGILVGSCYPVGVSNGVVTCSGTLVGVGKLYGTVNGVTSCSGILVGEGKLYGTINGVATCSATPVQLSMIGHSNGVATVLGTMFFRLHASSNGVATCSGTLMGEGKLWSTSNGIASVGGILKGRAQKVGASNGVAAVSGLLRAEGKLYGTINGIASVSGILVGEGILSGTTAGINVTSGILGGTGALAGLMGGVTITAAELIGWGILSGEISGVALLEGDLSERLPGKCDGIINSIALVGGTLGGWADLVGISTGVATVTGFYHPLFISEEVIKQSLITTEISEESFITAEVAWKSIITEEVGEELGIPLNYINVLDYGVISSDSLDQTNNIRIILEAGYDKIVYFPIGTYRCRNLYMQNDQVTMVDGTIKQIDGTIFDVTQQANEGTNILYIENATSGQLDFLEALINEAPNYYYYVAYYDDDYSIEGGGSGQVHHNGWCSRLTGINKGLKYITMADNIPAMPNYCGGTLLLANNPKVSILYNVIEVGAVNGVELRGFGTLDANRANQMDVNPVWVSGEYGHPEYAGAGANFIECVNCREGENFYATNLTLQNGKDNIMMWHMDFHIELDGIKSYNAHNKNICYLVNNNIDYPNISGLIQNCEVDGSDYEDGISGYANSDNLTLLDCIVHDCPRSGYSWNRENSSGNYAENLDAINCGTAFDFNRGGLTEVLTVKNIYIEDGGYHDKSGDYTPGVQIRSQITAKCGYIDIYNIGMICDKQTYGFLIFKANYINLIWESDCGSKYSSNQGNLTPPHAFGYWMRINSTSSDIVVDGGGVLEVKDFKYLFNIETGSTGIVIKNCNFSSYTNLGTIAVAATFESNWFKGVYYATGHP